MTKTASLTANQHRFLQNLFPGTDYLTTPEQMLVFETDASRLTGVPLAVVRPQTEEQIVELLRWAHTERIPLYPRARATNVVGLCVPEKPGIVISTLKMNRIIDVDADDFVAVVEPGIVTGDLQKHVEAVGLFYPPDPASFGISTIGGNVATCAGGMRAVKYGVTREWVLGCRVVLPGGKVIECGGRNHKNVVGLDLTRLMVGSEGTLGVMSNITLKLMPKPEATASLMAGFSSLEDAMGAVSSVFRAGILPTALEFMGAEVLDCLARLTTVPWPQGDNGARAVLLFRLDGSEAALPHDLKRLHTALQNGQSTPVWLEQGIGSEQEEPLWEIRRLINPASFYVAPNKISDDVTVPRGRLLTALLGIRRIADESGLTILTFGHVGDGNIHVNVMHDASDPDQKERAQKAKLAVMEHVLALRGTLSGEHGIGLTKAPYVHRQLGEEERRIMRDIKSAFDPHHIMNPGKAF
jgi:D-lactate dehydrogenase (cytochrome)/glycolate oxidase